MPACDGLSAVLGCGWGLSGDTHQLTVAGKSAGSGEVARSDDSESMG